MTTDCADCAPPTVYLAACLDCYDGGDLPLAFETREARVRWLTQHADETGHYRSSTLDVPAPETTE